MKDRIVLIDGHSILNRAFYGVPLLSNAKGLHTNAVFGFLNIMFKILDEEKPQYLAVAFDVKEKTFRHKMYEAYKGTRKPMPEELHEQVPVIRELLTAMGILIMEKPGLEADDILGTMAKRAMKEGMEVSLISGDRDLLQIADENIKIRIPKTKAGGKTEVENYYPEDVVAKYGVTPLEFIELKALMGDTSDNIPGVPKVGEKTATELITTYKSVSGVYEHIDEITKKSIQSSLIENRHLAELSLALARIEIDADIPFAPKDALMGELLTKEAYEICRELELKSILKRFDMSVTGQSSEISIQKIDTKREYEQMLKAANKAGSVGLRVIPAGEGETESEPVQLSLFETVIPRSLHGIAFSFEEGNAYFVPAEGELSEDIVLEGIRTLYKEGCNLSFYQVKENYKYLIKNDGAKELHEAGDGGKAGRGKEKKLSKELTENLTDVLIAAFLLNPLKSDYEISDIASEYLNMSLANFKQEFGKQTAGEAYIADREACIRFYCNEANAIYRVTPILSEELLKCDMQKLFREIEMPLSLVLFEMEQRGVIVKPAELKAYGDALTVKIEELEASITEAAGQQFNINSPKQLGEILFEKMGLPGGKKTKSGYSTAADVLEGLASEYAIVADVLEYRGLTKLKSTYAEGLGAQIEEDGRIHTNFHQTITATGRISSTEPNLQNIPIRMEMGRQIRKVFVPEDGCVFMDADYSQIELRILAHMSEDKELIDAYRQEADIHRLTASKVFHVPFEEVTALQRRNAKAVNFGIVYGISSFGLSQDLSISKKEADAYIKEYFNTYPGIKTFLDRAVSDAKERGYSLTMYQRRRPIPELKSSNFMQRGFGERVAMNAPIQGTAADIMKIAMLRVRDRLVEEGMRSKILLQVHDELLLEVYKEEEAQAAVILREEMEHASALAVHLEVDLHTGANWYETK